MSLVKADFQKIVRNEPQGALGVLWHDLVSDTSEDFTAKGFTFEAITPTNQSFTASQGVARDSDYWIAFNTTSIKKYSVSSGSHLTDNLSPFSGLPAGLNHIGDGSIYGSHIYVGVAEWDGTTTIQSFIVKYKLSDLTLVSYSDITAYKSSSGICLSLDKTEIYGVRYSTIGENKIHRFNITDIHCK